MDLLRLMYARITFSLALLPVNVPHQTSLIVTLGLADLS